MTVIIIIPNIAIITHEVTVTILLHNIYYSLTWVFFQQLKRFHEEKFGYASNGEVKLL